MNRSTQEPITGSEPPVQSGEPTYKAGYRRPPKRHQFPKGKSGNPKGRPKRPEGILIRDIFDSTQLTKNGGKITTREAYVRNILSRAGEGNARAFAKFMELMKAGGLFRKEAPKHAGIIYLDHGPSPSPETYEAWKRKDAAERASRIEEDKKRAEGGSTSQADQPPAEAPRVVRRPRRIKEELDENMIAIFKRLVSERTEVRSNGRRRLMTVGEAIVRKNCLAALQGDPMALVNVWRLAQEGDELTDRNDPAKVGKPIIMPRKFSTTEELLAFYGSEIVYMPKKPLD